MAAPGPRRREFLALKASPPMGHFDLTFHSLSSSAASEKIRKEFAVPPSSPNSTDPSPFSLGCNVLIPSRNEFLLRWRSGCAEWTARRCFVAICYTVSHSLSLVSDRRKLSASTLFEEESISYIKISLLLSSHLTN